MKSAIPDSLRGPLWSIMIPTYNPGLEYLELTLRSVLAQDPGPERMQIEVLDDCSTRGVTLEFLRRVGGERVSLHREPKNLGLAAIWNRCVERARGQWVHILHQDDVVMPGFYESLMKGATSPANVGLMYCRYAFMDGDGHWTGLSRIQARTAGVIPDALQHLAREQLLQTPAVVVRRSAYSAVGGFRSDLCYALDWEMWCRIARDYPVWFEPGILACYRIHDSNATHRLMLKGKDIEDARKCINIISGYLPDRAVAARVRRHSLRLAAAFAADNAWRLMRKGMFVASLRQVAGALKCGAPMAVLSRFWAHGLGALTRLAGSPL
jgi:glycosyltransferase involved in cell wall biosynthesis